MTEPTYRPLGPREVMRVVLPGFLASAALAAVGMVIMLLGHRVVGVALVGVAALGGMALRTRMVYQAQQRANRGQPPR